MKSYQTYPLTATCPLPTCVGIGNPNQKQDGVVNGGKSLGFEALARSNEEGVLGPYLKQHLGIHIIATQKNCGQWQMMLLGKD